MKTSEELAKITKQIINIFINNDLNFGETMAIVKTLEEVANDLKNSIDEESKLN